MAGIYIHIPYCHQKCNYCNFFSVVSTRTIPQMVDAICKEIELRASSIIEPIETIYIGGGTPSLIEYAHLHKIFMTLHSRFLISHDPEITLEANPDDINPLKLEQWKVLGINRLSIGIQSFNNDDLVYLNRIHSAETALQCIHQAQSAGFSNLTIDLIYGIPTLSNDKWKNNLDIFKSLSLPHLSAYALTVEPKTPLAHYISTGKVKPVDDAQSSEQFLIIMDFMERNGYLHYEISNYCSPSNFAKHNLSYWKGIKYYGFGPSAHSFNGDLREWNISNIQQYINSLTSGVIPSEKENLSTSDKYNEYVMTNLRTMWGCDLKYIEAEFGQNYLDYFNRQSARWLHLSEIKENRLILSKQGKLYADGIASDLFYVH